jgi:uncharacterized protein (DUF697 family)
VSYLDTINRIMEADYDASTPEEKQASVKEVIGACAIAAGVVTVQPLPLLDIALLTPIQIAMVRAINRIHGYSLDKKAVLEILSAFGASLVAQGAILAGAKFVPIFGWAVAIAMAYALTYAIGEVSDYYFANGRGVSGDELQDRFKQVYKEKKAEKEGEIRGNKSLKKKLEALKKAKEDGILSEEEFEKKKAEVMASF